MRDWKKVSDACRDASVALDGDNANQKKAAFPGCVLLVAQGGDVLFHEAFGCRSVLPSKSPMRRDMVFDIASLSKALVTSTLMMQALDSGRITVERKLSHIFQSFGTLGKEKITIRHLLNHSSGFPAYIPFYKDVIKADSGARAGMLGSRGAVEFVYRQIFNSNLEYQPGEKSVYSDVGFILLGNVLEVVSGGMHLDKLAQRALFRELDLRSMGYIDISKIKRRGLAPVTDIIVPTVDCGWRNRLLCGEVHDDNAFVMGGIAGHAGVFSAALDIHTLVRELLNCWHGRGKLVSRDTLRLFWSRDEGVRGSTWGLGWDTPSAENSSAGKLFSRKGVGHLGYTGCSLWIDPERELEVILLTNRVHPSVDNEKIKEFRPMIHDLILETLGYGA